MVIQLQAIRKSFAAGFLMKRHAILRGLDLHVQAGDTYALLGANGAGKSTTIRILLGLAGADSGHGTLLGRALGDVSVRRRLAYLPENPSFHEQLTPAEFLRYTGALLGLRGGALRQRMDDLLERVGLAQARDRRLRKLSKGMCQRLGLAQALLGEPELLILDEPMSGLDPPGRKMARDLIVEQRQAGRTVLFSTHSLGDAEMVCTRAGILRDGRVAQELDLDAIAALPGGSVEIRVTALAGDARESLRRRGIDVVRHGSTSVLLVPAGARTQEMLRQLLEWGCEVVAVQPRQATLEDIYLATQQAPESRSATAAYPAAADAIETEVR